MTVVSLVGDSHLARLTRGPLLELESRLDATVLNCAAGGLDAVDLLRQASLLARLDADAYVVSLGTNDSAPWRLVELATFRASLAEVFATLGGRLAYLTPPPLDEARFEPPQTRTNAGLAPYVAAAHELCRAHGVAIVDTTALAGADLHEDGAHLNDEGNARLLPLLAAALA